MNEREKIWMSLGLCGALEMMEASCDMAERLTEEHIRSQSATDQLMSDIASDIISKRRALQDNAISMEEYNSLPYYRG
jgi:hypothetical protein